MWGARMLDGVESDLRDDRGCERSRKPNLGNVVMFISGKSWG